MPKELPEKPLAPRPAPSLLARARRLPPVEWLISYLFGDDVFISYSRRDGVGYGEQLAHRLSRAGYSTRMDLWETEPGRLMPRKLMRALARSRTLVVVGSEGALQSPYVAKEIKFYRRTHRGRVSIVTVDVDGGVLRSPWFGLIDGLPPGPREDSSALRGDPPVPSDGVVERICELLRFTRRNRRLFKASVVTFAAVLLLLALGLTAGAGAAAAYVAAEVAELDARIAEENADFQRKEARKAEQEAARRTAEAAVSSVYAEWQTLKAENETLEARRQAGLAAAADRQRAEAERAAEAALELEKKARANAAEQQEVANSRRLSGQADRELNERPDLSFLLSAEAYSARPGRPTSEARRSLLSALSLYRNLVALLHPPAGSGSQDMGVAPDDRTIITTGGGDGIITFWDIESKKVRSTHMIANIVRDFVLTPDGKTLALAAGGHLVLWDTRRDSRLAVVPPPSGYAPYRVVAAAPDNKTLVTNGRPGEVVFWDIADPARPREVRKRLKVKTDPERADVAYLAFSPDGKRLMAVTSDAEGRRSKNIGGWELTDPDRPLPLPELAGHDSAVSKIVFSPDGGSFASVDIRSKVLLWDAETFKPREITTLVTAFTRRAAGSPAFSPDGKMLAVVTGSDTLFVYDVAGIGPNYVGLPRWVGHYGPGIVSAFFDRGSRHLVSLNSDGTLGLWRLDESRQLVRPLAGHEGLVSSTTFTPDGRMLASGGESGLISLTNTTAPAHTTPLERAPLSPVMSLDFNPRGTALAAGYADGALALWAPGADGRWSRREFPAGDIKDVRADGPKHDGLYETYSKRPVWFVHFADAGRTLVSVGPGPQVLLWDARNALARPRVVPLPGDETTPTHSAAASADGRTLAVGYDGGSVRLLDTRAPGLGWVTLNGGHKRRVTNLAFSRDGRWLASTDDAYTAVLWRMGRRPEACRTFNLWVDSSGGARLDTITALAFGPDGRTLVLGSGEQVVLVDVEMGSIMGTLDAGVEKLRSLSFTPGGGLVAAGGKGAVTTIDLSPASWVEALMIRANRSLYPPELQRFKNAGQGPNCPPAPAARARPGG